MSEFGLRNSPEDSFRTDIDIARQWFGRLLVDGRPTTDFGHVMQHYSALYELYGGDFAGEGFEETILERLAILTSLSRTAEATGQDETVTAVIPEKGDGMAEKLGREVVTLTLKDAYAEEGRRNLADLANRDTLTNVHNRRGEQNIVRSWLRKSQERGVLTIDVSNFKRINDTLGYDIGDQALIEATLEINNSVRHEDATELLRLGGDEFRLLVGDISEKGFKRLYARLLAKQFDKAALPNDQQKNIRLWNIIYSRYGEASAKGLPFTPYIQTIAEKQDGREVRQRHLFINGERICLLRDIVVLSVGGAYGKVKSMEDYESLCETSMQLAKAHNAKLHARTGGAYRVRERH